MAKTISASVGQMGTNRRPDAITVQELLNKVAPEAGGPVPKLAVDGLPWTKTIAAIRKFQKEQCGFAWPDGRVDPGGKTLAKLNEFDSSGPFPWPPAPPPPPPTPPGPPAVFIVHDVRLFGWKPHGDVLEVNGDTPLQWMIDSTIKRGKANNGNLILKVMCHGLPGFLQCCRGALQHPTLNAKVTDPAKGGLYIGPGKGGISINDLDQMKQLAGHVKLIEFHSCLVARIGQCPEANGHQCYDGNAFCFRLAQTTQAEVMASIHIQWYWTGKGPTNGMHFGDWNGLVFTWGPPGNIIATTSYPYEEKGGPPPPGTAPT
jgi:hypothetical protein